MAIVTLLPDGKITIEPFTREVHSTSFHSGTIIATDTPPYLEFV